MQQDPNNTAELINLHLEKCDRQYQEIQLLKGKLEDHTDVDALKSSYEQTISGQQEKIISLESQVAYLKRRVGGQSSERFIKERPQTSIIDFERMDLLPKKNNWQRHHRRKSNRSVKDT